MCVHQEYITQEYGTQKNAILLMLRSTLISCMIPLEAGILFIPTDRTIQE